MSNQENMDIYRCICSNREWLGFMRGDPDYFWDSVSGTIDYLISQQMDILLAHNLLIWLPSCTVQKNVSLNLKLNFNKVNNLTCIPYFQNMFSLNAIFWYSAVLIYSPS